MPIIHLGLGSNLGDRAKNIRSAVDGLSQNGIIPVQLSSIIETAPVGGPEQGLFLNAVLQAETQLTPLELLTMIQTTEFKLGRIRTVKNGPRTIDIDILLYDGVSMNTPELTIPHPRMSERDFVMAPLRELACRP